jgi:hypothetical protein
MSDQQFDFTTSNLILMVGGQVLILVLVLFVILFGTQPVTSPVINILSTTVKGGFFRKNSS